MRYGAPTSTGSVTWWRDRGEGLPMPALRDSKRSVLGAETPSNQRIAIPQSVSQLRVPDSRGTKPYSGDLNFIWEMLVSLGITRYIYVLELLYGSVRRRRGTRSRRNWGLGLGLGLELPGAEWRGRFFSISLSSSFSLSLSWGQRERNLFRFLFNLFHFL